jgi:hypothetical protein
LGAGVSGELNGIVDICRGTLRLDGTVVASVNVNVGTPLGEIAYNRDWEWSGTVVGPPRYEPLIELGSEMSWLQWAPPCK